MRVTDYPARGMNSAALPFPDTLGTALASDAWTVRLASIMALRIYSVSVVRLPGECGMRIAFVRDEAPISLSMSKYCVISTRFITS